ncbi:hypothetical protein GP486_008104 [Trichoglossum hirsutum]|uniref:Decapping nuclease n=1 Tax=Trichoglossum hirsutum TaxID=265104 RepID=A0A9P8IEK8_9PEZI|nr:hypothetical protein GP486_008104 [Trichoglossum hirsutum]
MTTATFDIPPVHRFAGSSAAIRRPKEIACFSYDDQRRFHLDESSLRYYYPARLGADLSRGFDAFEKLDDTADEHLDGLLSTIMALEKETGKQCEADFITWRGMMTKVSYKFETLSLMPGTWDATPRDYIEGREDHVVNNSAQYCSVVRTGIGKSKLVIGGEVDAGRFRARGRVAGEADS